MQTYALLGTANHMISIGVAITPSRLRLDPMWDQSATIVVFRNWPEKRNLERERTHTGRVVSCW